MKISTIRAALILADLGILAGISLVVMTGIKEKNGRREQAMAFNRDLAARLDAVRPEGLSNAGRVEYGENIKKVNISGYVEVAPVEAAPVAPTPPVETKPPLETVLKVVGIELIDSTILKSRILVSREGPTPMRPDEPKYFEEGSAIPWAFGAVVKKVEPTRVLFDYAGGEVALVPKAPPASAAAGSRGGRVEVQPSEDVNTWVNVDPQRPGNVEITNVGVVSISHKGEQSLEGIRWSTETLEDGRAAVRLMEVPPDSVFAKSGAQAGDTLVSINGNRVTSKGDIVDYVKRNPDLSRYEVVFLRRGVRNIRVVTVPRK